MMPFFKVLHTLWLWGLFISSQEKPSFQWFIYSINCIGDTEQGAVEGPGCACVCEEGPGPGSCRTVRVGFKQTRGRSYGNAEGEVPSSKGMWNIVPQPQCPVFPLRPPSKHMTPLWRWHWAHSDHFQIQVSEVAVDMEQIVLKQNCGAALIRILPGTSQRYSYKCLRSTGRQSAPSHANFKKKKIAQELHSSLLIWRVVGTPQPQTRTNERMDGQMGV